jgi:threonine synthase
MGVISAYRDRLPVGVATPELSLGEGSTPLVRGNRIGEALGVELYLKCEGSNPTGSFKDRGMAVAVARAVEAGADAVVCASTGNTAASAAAYAARAGLEAIVLTPVGAVAGAKLAQARIAGARLVEVPGSFEDALRRGRELADEDGRVLVNSLNPDRIEGQKTLAFELLEQLGRAPDVVALPYCGAGVAPRLIAGEARERTATCASAIRIGEPAHRQEVEALVAAGRAEVVSLTDDELTAAWHRLAALEGTFCEPASAASVAALTHVALSGGELAVCVLTGHGLKDTSMVAARP